MSQDRAACHGLVGFGSDANGTYALQCAQRVHCARYHLALKAAAEPAKHANQNWHLPNITNEGCDAFIEHKPVEEYTHE